MENHQYGKKWFSTYCWDDRHLTYTFNLQPSRI